MSSRRQFITLLGGATAAWPLAARAQQPRSVRRIAMLMGLAENDPEGQQWVQTFLQTLRGLGWRSDTNLQIDLRWGANNPDRMRTFAKELVELHPDLINVTSTPATAAILQETQTIPVVFSVVSDPVGAGFVSNLPRPGGNVTGFINIEASLAGKWLDLLKEIAPRVSRVAMLFNPASAPQMAYYRGPLEAAAASRAIVLLAAPLRDAAEIGTTITALAQDGSTGFIVLPDGFVITNRDQIIALTARHRLPAIFSVRLFVKAGGLLSYGVDLSDLQRRAAIYADLILKGAKPADLPVQLPTKFELVINLQTARMLGLEVPPTLLATADEVIE
jgi:putative tryptophan/tyrosine transport system substrate-binding protein